MRITFEKFEERHFDEYKSWFKNEATRRYLGHVDEEWLNHILNDKSGEEMVAMSDGRMVGVLGITFPTKEYPHYVITNLAVHPEYKRKGIGTCIINYLKNKYPLRAGEHWVTYVHIDNLVAKNFMHKLKWVRGKVIEDMITFTDL